MHPATKLCRSADLCERRMHALAVSDTSLPEPPTHLGSSSRGCSCGSGAASPCASAASSASSASRLIWCKGPRLLWLTGKAVLDTSAQMSLYRSERSMRQSQLTKMSWTKPGCLQGGGRGGGV